MNLLPLGTVINVNDNKAFIIGYASAEKEETTTYGYFIVPYPIGFTSIDKVVFIPHNHPFTVVAEGYKTKAYERVLSILSNSFEVLESASSEDVIKFDQILKERRASRKEEFSE